MKSKYHAGFAFLLLFTCVQTICSQSLPQFSSVNRHTPSGVGSGAQHGNLITLQGDRALVSSPGWTSSGLLGAVHEYRLGSGNWSFQRTITPPAGTINNSQFGISTAHLGDWMVIGAPRDRRNGVNDAGAAFVYQQVSGNWTLRHTITAFNTFQTTKGPNYCGQSVAVNSRFVFVGIPYDDTFTTNISNVNFNGGAVMVYRISGNNVIRSEKLGIPTIGSNEYFGYSMVCTESDLFVTAYQRNTVFHFALEGNNWVYKGEMRPSTTPQASSLFGWSLAVYGNTLAVSAPFEDYAGFTDAGAVYLFNRSNGAWQYTAAQRIASPHNGSGVQLGWRGVSVYGDLLALSHGNSVPDRNGRFWLYQKTGSDFTLRNAFFSPAASTNELFGASPVVSGNHLLSGAPLRTDPVANAGTVFFFRSPEMLASNQTADGYVDVEWRVNASCASFSPPRQVYAQLFDSTRQLELDAEVYDDLNNKGYVTGQFRHFHVPNARVTYEYRLLEYGPGTPLCPVARTSGSTLPFIAPSFDAGDFGTSEVSLSFSSASTFNQRFRLYRDGKQIAVLDTGERFYQDPIIQDDTAAAQNGRRYRYCIEGFNQTRNMTSVRVCDSGGTYDIGFTASDEAFSDHVRLRWNDVQEYASYILIERDGSRLISLPRESTTYEDRNAIPGFPHVYRLSLMFESEGNPPVPTLNYTETDRGSIAPNGAISGRVLNKTGGFGVQNVRIQARALVNGDSVLLSTLTDAAGNFRFDRVFYNQTAVYTLTASLGKTTFTENNLPLTLNLAQPQASVEFESNITITVATSGRFNIASFDAVAIAVEDKVSLLTRFSATDTVQMLLRRDNAVLSSWVSGSSAIRTITVNDERGIPGQLYTYTLEAFTLRNNRYYKETFTDTVSFPRVAPLLPANVTLTADANLGRVRIQWNHTSALNRGVAIYRNGVRIGDALGSGNSSYTDLSGANGKVFNYSLRPFVIGPDNNRYEATAVNPAAVTYPTLRAVQGLSQAATAQGGIRLSWTYPFNPTQYNFSGVKVVRTTLNGTDTIGTVPFNAPPYLEDMMLVPGEGNVTYRVITWKEAGNIGPAASVNVSLVTPIPAPVNLMANAQEGLVEVYWDFNSNVHIDGYRLISGTGDTLFTSPMRRFAAIGFPSNYTTAPVIFRVAAYREMRGQKRFGSEATISAGPLAGTTAVLPSVTALAATNQLPDKVTLTWNYPNQFLPEFRIYRDGQQIGTAGAKARVFQDNWVNDNAWHAYQVEPVIGSNRGRRVNVYGKRNAGLRFQGMVLNEHSGNGIPGARVSLQYGYFDEQTSSFIYRNLAWTRSDSTGYYALSNLDIPRPASVALVASAPGSRFRDSIREIFLYHDNTRQFNMSFFDTIRRISTRSQTISKPIAFRATVNPTGQSVELHWGADGQNLSGFRLYRGLELIAELTASEARYFTDRSGAPGISYTYRVRAYWQDQPGRTLESDFALADATYPDLLPVTGGATVPLSDALELSWNHVSDLHSYYEIRRNGGFIANVPCGRGLLFTDSTGVQGQFYTYQITSVLERQGQVFRSAPHTFQVQYPELSRPVQLSAALDSNQVRLSWHTPSNHITHFNIYRSGVLLGRMRSIPFTGSSNSFTDTTGLPGIRYRYEVRSVYFRSSASHESKSVFADTDFPAFALVSNLIAVAQTNQDKVRIGWSYPYPARTGFRIARQTSLGGSIQVLGETDRNTFVFEDLSGTPGQTYFYSVTVLDTRQQQPVESRRRRIAAVVVFPALSPPTNVSATLNTYNVVALKWVHPTTDLQTSFEIRETYRIDRTAFNASGFNCNQANIVLRNTTDTFSSLVGERSGSKLNYVGRNGNYPNGFDCPNFPPFFSSRSGRDLHNNYFEVRTRKWVGGAYVYSTWVQANKVNNTSRLANSRIATFQATDNAYTDRVFLSWTLSGVNSNAINSFKIYRDAQLLESVDGSDLEYFDTDPVPGKKHIYSILVDYGSGVGAHSEQALSDFGSIPGNGEIKGSVITAIGGSGVRGATITATAQVDGTAYNYRATTDNEGNFLLSNLYYGSGRTRYTVTASFTGHVFENPVQTADLDAQVNRAQLAPFRDKTAFVITGAIARQQACALDSVEVRLISRFRNSTRKTETSYSSPEGVYSFVIDPYDPQLLSYELLVSDTQVRMAGARRDTSYHRFDQRRRFWNAFAGWPLVQQANITDTLKYPIQFVVENACGPVGAYRFIVEARSNDGCYTANFRTALNGRLSVQLPPYDYRFTVIGAEPANAAILSVTDYLSVRPAKLNLAAVHAAGGAARVRKGTQPLSVVPMIYHKTPRIAVSGNFQYFCNDPRQPMLFSQGARVNMRFTVSETHGSITCNVSTGYVIIKNDAAVKKQDTVFYSETLGRFPDYVWTAGDPMNVAPYTRPFIAEYHTESDGFLAELVQAAIIDGTVAQPGSDVIVSNEDGQNFQIPMMVLRDPPGDQSYSYIEKGTSITRSLNISDRNSGYGGIRSENEFTIFGVGAAFDAEIKASGGSGRQAGYSVTVNTKTRIQTPADNSVANADNTNYLLGSNGDVIVGAGVALKYGISERISVDNANCRITKTSIVDIAPEKVRTTWVYTVDQIQKLIDEYNNNLALLEQGRFQIEGKSRTDSRSYLTALRNNWQSVLDYHFKDNVPFIQLCDTRNYTALPEPYRSQATTWARNGFCKEIGTYSIVNNQEIFRPNAEIKWTTELMDKYNKVGQAVRNLSSNDWQIRFPGGLVFTDGELNNTKLDQGYRDLYGLDAENITFSGNTSFEKAVTVTETKTRSFEQFWSMDLDFFFGVVSQQDLSLSVGGGFGAIVLSEKKLVGFDTRTGAIFGYNHEFSRSSTNESVRENTVGYVLTDNDAGDQFSVSVFRGNDPMQTPYFALLGGRSSCPAEPGTIYRDRPHIAAADINGQFYNTTQRDLDPDKPFVLPLKLSNLAPEIFNEDRYMSLSQSQNFNNYGARLSVQGTTLGSVEFRIPSAGSAYTFLEISRPPGYYDLPDLMVSLGASCPNLAEPDNYNGFELPLAMYFRHPCPDVTLLSPGNNWVIRKANPLVIGDQDEKLVLRIGDYDVENQLLQDITLQYRRIGSNTWRDIVTLSRTQLRQFYLDNRSTYASPQYPFVWDIKGNAAVVDGEYEIRARAFCGASGVILSEVISGKVDRANVSIFGVPQPADGVLSLGDEISVTFNKEILCDLSGVVYQFRRSSDQSLVPMQAVCAGRKIIFTPMVPLASLDGTEIEATLLGVRDLSENEQIDTIRWRFTVVNNPLYWLPQALNIELYQGSRPRINAALVNSMDNAYDFLLNSKATPWLSVAPLNGTVQRSSSREIQLTVNTTTLAPGLYADTVFAEITNVSGFSRLRLPIRLRVVPRPVNWSVDPSRYSSNATVICNYNFDSSNVLSRDTLDRIAAFIDGELRGVANVQRAGNFHRAYLNVAGNSADRGKPVRFYVWHAATGIEYAASMRGSLNYEPNAFFGTTPEPRLLDVNRDLDSVRYVPLRAGWNYLAFNTEQSDMGVNNMLAGLKPSDGDVLKTLSGSAHYDKVGGRWVALSNGLSIIQIAQGYQLYLAKADTLKLTGRNAAMPELSINAGWNLIGNPYSNPVSINSSLYGTAFSNLALIKNDVQAGDYDSASQRWNGISQLIPNKSYLLRNRKISFATYRSNTPDLNCAALVKSRYELNMTFLAGVQIDGQLQQSDAIFVRAFRGNQCRGTGKLEFVPALNKYLLNLFVYSDTLGESIHFKIYDAANDRWHDVPDSLQVRTDWAFGTPSSPYVFSNRRDVTGLQPWNPVDRSLTLRLYPNPTEGNFSLIAELPRAEALQIEILDATGRSVMAASSQAQAGLNRFEFDAAALGLVPGVYMLKVESASGWRGTTRFIRQ